MRTESITIQPGGRVKKIIYGNFIRVNNATDRFTVELTNSIDGPSPTVATLLMGRTSQFNTDPGVYFTDVELINNNTASAITTEIVVGVGEFTDNLLNISGNLVSINSARAGTAAVQRNISGTFSPANPTIAMGVVPAASAEAGRRCYIQGYFCLSGSDYPVAMSIVLGGFTIGLIHLFNRSPNSPPADFEWQEFEAELLLPPETTVFAGPAAISASCALTAGMQLQVRASAWLG